MTSPWATRFRRFNSPARVELRLCCFPYAGGGISVFNGWAEDLPPAVEVCVPELPGRDTLIGQPALGSVDSLVACLIPALEPLLDVPVAFFGHSMGALVAFELIRELRRTGRPVPRALLVSGHRAPHLPDPRAPLHRLPDAEFIAELRRLEGTPPEALANQELMELFLPLLRADFKLSETYAYRPEPPLELPIAAWGGRQDAEVTLEEVKAWRQQTRGSFALEPMPGSHFFIHGSAKRLRAGVRRELLRVLEAITEPSAAAMAPVADPG